MANASDNDGSAVVRCDAPTSVTVRKANTTGGSTTVLKLPPVEPFTVFWDGAKTVGDIKGYEIHTSVSFDGITWSAFQKAASCTTKKAYGSFTGLCSAASIGTQIRVKVKTRGVTVSRNSMLSVTEARIVTQGDNTQTVAEKDVLARRTKLKVQIEGVDVSSEVNKGLISLSYTDNEEDECDDLQIKLEDREGNWLKKWLNELIETAAQRQTEVVSLVVDDKHAGIRRNIGASTAANYDGVICQTYLRALGYYGGAVDGKGSSVLSRAIKSFQIKEKLRTSGICDKATWKVLTSKVNGSVIPRYICYFKAIESVTVYAKSATTSKTIATILPGEECAITDHVKSGWFKCLYQNVTGYVKGKKLTLERVKENLNKTKPKTKGLALVATISALDDDGIYQNTDCGRFELDSIKGSGFPSSIVIKGTSLTYAGGIRTTQNDKAWVQYRLSGIASEIAAKGKLGLLFDAAKDPQYERIEQEKETDLSFLMNLCHKAGFSLKIAFNQLIIYDQAAYERAGEKVKITYGDGSYEKWSVETGEGDVQYDNCVVRYTNPSTGKVIEGTAYSEDYDEEDEEHETLVVTNHKVKNVSQATALAEKLLRLHNKYEKSAQFTMPGSRKLCAGTTVRLVDFGAWSGKYIISKAKHEVSKGGYTTQITLRCPPT